MELPSKLLNEAVNRFARLPGIGNRTALRLVLHLLKSKNDDILQFSASVSRLASEIKYCRICFNISDTDVCSICSDSRRDHSTVCVVQDIRDVIAIENTLQYKGVYHILGGVISPMDGIGPDGLRIQQLLERANTIKEIILALPTTMEGETTAYYVHKRLSGMKNNTASQIIFTSISRGIGIGEQLEYTDEITLGRSIMNRVPFEKLLAK